MTATTAKIPPDPQLVLSRLKYVRKTGDGKWSAQYPSHDDRVNNLSVDIGDDGKLLVHCHAGCEAADVMAAVGLTMKDLFPAGDGRHKGNNKPGRVVASYDYRDESGKLLFQSVRFEPKGFSQRQPDGKGGWKWNLQGVRRVLYRLTELLAADAGETVFVVEGEKDCNLLATLGLVATTNPGGADKWRQEYNEMLRGRHVVIFPDNDGPGRKHAQTVARSLHGTAASVKVVEL